MTQEDFIDMVGLESNLKKDLVLKIMEAMSIRLYTENPTVHVRAEYNVLYPWNTNSINKRQHRKSKTNEKYFALPFSNLTLVYRKPLPIKKEKIDDPMHIEYVELKYCASYHNLRRE